MNSYTTEVDKLEHEIQHLWNILDSHSFSDDEEYALELAVSQAKRVRRQSTLLVRALARHIEQLQPKEGTSE